MNSAELLANVRRFNDGSQRAQKALRELADYKATHGMPAELVAILNAYVDACSDMLETSSELVAPALAQGSE